MLWTVRSRALGALILEYVVGELFRLPEMRKDDDSLYRILLQETASAKV
jgi:hypothetical protein